MTKNPQAESGDPSDWCYFLMAEEEGVLIGFAPLEGEHEEPRGVATTMIKTLTSNLKELEEMKWIFRIPEEYKCQDVVDRFRACGFVIDPKAVVSLIKLKNQVFRRMFRKD